MTIRVQTLRSHADAGENERYKTDNSAGYDVFIDGELVFSAGVAVMSPGVVQAWLAIHNQRRFVQCWRDFWPGFKLAFRRMTARCVRVQAYVACGFIAGQNFIERLGLRVESTARKYLDGHDYYCFARVR